MKKHTFTLIRRARFCDFHLLRPTPKDDETLFLCQGDVEEYFDLTGMAGNEIVIEIALEDPGNPQAYKARIGNHGSDQEDQSVDLLLKNGRWQTTSIIERLCKYLSEVLKLSRKRQPFWVTLYHY